MLLALLLAAIKCQQYVTSTMSRVHFFWALPNNQHIHTNTNILAPLAYFSVSALGSVVSGAKFVKGAYLRLLPGGLLVVVLLVVVLLVVALLVVTLLVVVFMVVVVVEVLLVVVL